MLHLVKTTNLIVKYAPVFCGLLFPAVLAVLPASAQTECTSWNLGKDLTIIQRGVKLPIYLTLEQKGRVITGNAGNNVIGGTFDRSRQVNGQVDGTFDGETLSFQIYWPDGLTGVYNGKVLPSGRLDGDTYDKNNTRIRQTWYSNGVLACAPIPQAEPPKPKPIKSSGKARPSEPAPAPPKPPFITASSAIVQPFLPLASVYLGWDGGPDHPKADVWVSIDNGPEIPAFKLNGPAFNEPKIAAIEIKVDRKRLYKYFLKDGGTILSTVVISVP